MAIDTAEKRRSAFNVFGFRKFRAVTPNASKDQEWRQEVFWGYSGILATIAVVIPNRFVPKIVRQSIATIRKVIR